jgi:hypothetical protein
MDVAVTKIGFMPVVDLGNHGTSQLDAGGRKSFLFWIIILRLLTIESTRDFVQDA